MLHTRLWKVQSNLTLEIFIFHHDNAYVLVQAASYHVTYQLPNYHSRVGYLLTEIQCNDSGLQDAMDVTKIMEICVIISRLPRHTCYLITQYKRRELIILEISVIPKKSLN